MQVKKSGMLKGSIFLIFQELIPKLAQTLNANPGVENELSLASIGSQNLEFVTPPPKPHTGRPQYQAGSQKRTGIHLKPSQLKVN